MNLYEVSFVARVDLHANDAQDAMRRVEVMVQDQFNPGDTHEVDVTRVAKLRQCVCCSEVLDRWVPPQFDTKPEYCDDCSKGKCDSCVDTQRARWAENDAAHNRSSII